jgi:hypothetical protein
VELIRRIFVWTPRDLAVAYLAASFGSAYLIMLAVVLSDGFYEPWWDWLAMVALLPVFGAMLLGFVVAIGLAIFGVGPTWWLRRFHSAPWMWLVALAGGAVAGLSFLLIVPTDSDGSGPMILPEVLAVGGAIYGVVWWLLASRVIRKDSMTDEAAEVASWEYA